MYVRAGRPAFARPCVGIHKSTSLMSSSLLLQQCPACLVRLTWIVFVIGGRWPYSWCLVGCCCQDSYEFISASPAMSCMSGSPNLNSFRDRGQVAVQLVSCGVLLPELVQDCTQCKYTVWLNFLLNQTLAYYFYWNIIQLKIDIITYYLLMNLCNKKKCRKSVIILHCCIILILVKEFQWCRV